MPKKSMIIELHIQIANKQLNVYNNTIITYIFKAVYKNRKPILCRSYYNYN